MKIRNKLFLILVSFSSILIITLLLTIQWSIGQGMIDYVSAKEIDVLEPLAQELSEVYQQDNSWQSLAGKHRQLFHLVQQQLVDSQFLPRKPSPPPNEFGEMYRPLPFFEHPEPAIPPEHKADYALLNHDKTVIAGQYDALQTYTLIQIDLGNKVIGYLAVVKRKGLADGFELQFVEQQNIYLLFIGLVILLLTLIIVFFLARNLVEPVNSIAEGMRQLSQNNFDYKLALKRQDELGQLSEDFNKLSLTLENNEQVRKRWLANTSHELRTPITILMGELEAMLLGIRPLSMDNLRSVNDEAEHLKRLINDLHMLNSAELGGIRFDFQPIVINEFIKVVEQKFYPLLQQNKIDFSIYGVDKGWVVQSDQTRLVQLFSNILMNALHYAKCSNITISMTRLTVDVTSYIQVDIEDNGIGVEQQHLPHLFEYLYRSDEARNRQEGGSGLGLSLCQHIAKAHHGDISAFHSPLGGLGIRLLLPLVENKGE